MPSKQLIVAFLLLFTVLLTENVNGLSVRELNDAIFTNTDWKDHLVEPLTADIFEPTPLGEKKFLSLAKIDFPKENSEEENERELGSRMQELVSKHKKTFSELLDKDPAKKEFIDEQMAQVQQELETIKNESTPSTSYALFMMSFKDYNFDDSLLALPTSFNMRKQFQKAVRLHVPSKFWDSKSHRKPEEIVRTSVEFYQIRKRKFLIFAMAIPLRENPSFSDIFSKLIQEIIHNGSFKKPPIEQVLKAYEDRVFLSKFAINFESTAIESPKTEEQVDQKELERKIEIELAEHLKRLSEGNSGQLRKLNSTAAVDNGSIGLFISSFMCENSVLDQSEYYQDQYDLLIFFNKKLNSLRNHFIKQLLEQGIKEDSLPEISVKIEELNGELVIVFYASVALNGSFHSGHDQAADKGSSHQ